MNRGDGSKSRSITVNDGGDDGWRIASDAGLTRNEQPMLQIAASAAQMNAAMPFMCSNYKHIYFVMQS